MAAVSMAHIELGEGWLRDDLRQHVQARVQLCRLLEDKVVVQRTLPAPVSGIQMRCCRTGWSGTAGRPGLC